MNFGGTITVLNTYEIKPNYSDLGRNYGMDRRTAKKRYEGVENQKRGRKEGSKLDKYSDIIKDKLSIPGTNKQAVYKFILMNIDKDIGSYSNFNKYVNKNKDILIESNKEAHVRFETECGKQLQFDWKGPIKLANKYGEVFEFYVFSSTLCASRLHNFIYSKFMTLESVERCLIETFKYISGVPEECLTDNMSSIVNYSENKFKDEFKSFAKDMGFNPKKCKCRKPETKGKDESCNRFVNWIKPYNGEFETEEDLIKIFEKITNEVNKQVNQTTNMPPIELYIKEKEYLQPLPKEEIIEQYLDTFIPAKVSNTLLVYYKGTQYSVPSKFIGKTVKLNVIGNKLNIYYNKDLIVTHEISEKKFNYANEHYKEALANTLSNKTDNQIESIAKKNLELLDQFTINRKKV
mgnify:CR=1 FL=1